ncbi:DUF5345 family protein [Ruminiclostridium cellobioparum]|uniref:DUF5345 family protein n=1 Tax=Ruminiclostridium cellobioparum TaxID=29355 RepID=UPI00048A2869|nr:DUF5345 family protein [Ruminiclostridium cellobioparum]
MGRNESNAEGLEGLEGLKEVSKMIDELDLGTPDLMTMADFVSDEQTRLASKNNRQLAWFSCTALAVIAALIMLYQLSALLFALIQGLFFTVPTILLIIKRSGRDELA